MDEFDLQVSNLIAELFEILERKNVGIALQALTETIEIIVLNEDEQIQNLSLDVLTNLVTRIRENLDGVVH